MRCQRCEEACGALAAHASRAHAWFKPCTLAAARRLTLRSRLARAAGVGTAASAQGAQAQLSSPQKADQHGSLAQHDAVYQARFIASAGMSQSVVLPYVGPAQAAAGGLRPPCADICWMPASALLRTPLCQLKDGAVMCCAGLSVCACLHPMVLRSRLPGTIRHLTGMSTSAAAQARPRSRASCHNAGT